MTFSSDPVVRVKNASIFQDDEIVLNEISFDIEKGEFLYLVGRTGSGKSSLLKTLYADLSLRLGDMEVAGVNIREIKKFQIPFLRRKLGIVFQDFQLFPDRTVEENLLFVMKATGWKEKAKMKTRSAEVLMKVGLGAISKKFPHQLSGGEQQRVVIARALINEPLLFIADEPTGNLDPAVSEGILKVFQEINRSGTAVLMATHDLYFVNKYPNRILKCVDGKLADSKIEDVSLEQQFR